MKKIIASLIVTTVVLTVLGIIMNNKTRSRLNLPAAHGKVLDKQTDIVNEQPAFLETNCLDGQEESLVAEHILADISEARIEQNTQDLMTAVTRLANLCQKAVEIQDAMLSVQLVDLSTGSSDRQQDTESLGE